MAYEHRGSLSFPFLGCLDDTIDYFIIAQAPNETFTFRPGAVLSTSLEGFYIHYTSPGLPYVIKHTVPIYIGTPVLCALIRFDVTFCI